MRVTTAYHLVPFTDGMVIYTELLDNQVNYSSLIERLGKRAVSSPLTCDRLLKNKVRE